ncbi:right-handed parallel beta-helix repeat-containing protein [uncultured Roseobacter sp.]|uniref:right-handed parallel beta-helix repeat-containing protein n=1 Tax=uncultured Roseobacter sp. TaxID=114847 RepID=UPI00262B606B|nr:right-handed parallel beta-helix repeat-containing protein [uncultured Roseobacter sp.]
MDTDKSVAAIEISQGPEHGNVTVNPDNTLSVVMSGSDYSGPLSFDYKVSYEDGTTEVNSLSLDVSAPAQAAGWGQGQHYMLEEDENGDIIVETGEVHRKVYISESDDALTRADIAAMEGLEESDITGSWLKANGEYGADEEMALSSDIGMELWSSMTNWRGDGDNSHWLLFEKGYTYEDLGRIIEAGADGESELHPMHITSWGEGDRPVIDTKIVMYQADSANIVFSDIELTAGVFNSHADNTIFSDVSVTDAGMSIQGVDNFTFHDSEVTHVTRDAPDADYWGNPRGVGMFVKGVDGILIEGSIAHHNAWEDDYRTDGSTEGGMPPSMFSHNIYLQADTRDVTFRDNIISQGASFGAHIRGGGYVEDNIFLDNNAAVDFLGGDYKNAGPVGNFTLFSDNVITSGGYKTIEKFFIGAKSVGVVNDGVATTMLDNIIAHMADPNNPDEIAAKTRADDALKSPHGAAYDDTIIYNWAQDQENGRGLARDKNVDDLDRDQADQTTIQNFAATLLGKEGATIGELMDYILTLPDTDYDDFVTADDFIAYFQNGFGVTGNGDEAETDHRFIPNNLADGIRWDNRLNWDSEDVPDNGDSVNLAGNWVQYGATTSLSNLTLGSGGKLHVNSGRLTVDDVLETGPDGALISTQGAGQFWTDGYTDDARLTIEVNGGRFANTGDFTGQTSIHALDGQTLLATDNALFTLQAGSELRIEGSEARVGFDGTENGTAVFQMADDAVLTFDSDEDGFSTVEEFRSGRWDQAGSDVQSGASLDGTLQLDLSDYTGGAGSHTLIDVDALDGIFDQIDVFGLGSAWNAEVVTDYDSDELRLEITAGSGSISYSTIGDAGQGGDESADLWAALTQGQGVFDESPPVLNDENYNDMPDIMAA